MKNNERPHSRGTTKATNRSEFDKIFKVVYDISD